MLRFSANLGFLWTELSLPDAIYAAKNAGFEAVECHWPYDTPAESVLSALKDTSLPMLGLNTKRGNVEAGDNGVAAIPGREVEAQDYIDEAINYAIEIDCPNIHVMAGFTYNHDEAEITFRENLQYACAQARRHAKTILIEPLNKLVAPHYHLSTLEQALVTIKAVEQDNLKIMFDCYHLQIMGGNLTNRLSSSLEHIGHIQFASVPKRIEPDVGELNYKWLLNEIVHLGWDGYFGAEYKPKNSTEEGLGWMTLLSKQK